MADAEPKSTSGTYKVKNGSLQQIFYVRESALQSIIADFFTFGILIGITTLNFEKWGGHWYFSAVIIFLWFVFVTGRAKSKLREFNSRSDLVDFLIHELEEEGDRSK